jgi:hypothetical protein
VPTSCGWVSPQEATIRPEDNLGQFGGLGVPLLKAPDFYASFQVSPKRFVGQVTTKYAIGRFRCF